MKIRGGNDFIILVKKQNSLIVQNKIGIEKKIIFFILLALYDS